jgi:competence protein ComEC
MQWWMLKKPVHISWQIAVLCGAIAVSVFTVPFVGAFFAGFVWLILALALLGFCLWQQKLFSILLLIVAGVLIGFWRGGNVQLELSPYEKLIGHVITLEGRVSEDPERSEKHGMVVRLDVHKVDKHALPGVVWMSITSAKDVKRGDTITVRGKLASGFGSFSGSMYRAEVMSIQRPHDIALETRDWFAIQVRKVITEPAAALGLGFLTGQSQGLLPELGEAMKTAGLTHIVVASGYNLTILVRLARRMFARVSKYLAALSSTVLIGGFMAVTGLSPSMSRAGLVAGLCLAAWYYGRKFHPLVLLPFVAALTLLVNPLYGWGDLGWQLSFAAFAGVMILAPLMQAYFFGTKKPGTFRQVAGETIAAQLATLPILVGVFGQFSNVALPANLLVVPLVPLAMLLVFLAGVLAAFLLPAALMIGTGATILLEYMILITNFFASQAWAITELSLPWYGVLLGYGVLTALCIYFWWATRFDLRSSNIVE